MRYILTALFCIFSSHSLAETIIYNCPSKEDLKLNLEKNTLEFGLFSEGARFGPIPTEFIISENFIELKKSNMTRKVNFKFSRNDGNVYVSRSGKEFEKYDTCIVTTSVTIEKKVLPPKIKIPKKINSDYKKNRYTFNCVKDGRYARNRGGYIIKFDFPNKQVEWITSAHDEIIETRIFDLKQIDLVRDVYNDGGYKFNDNIIYTKVYFGSPSYFNLKTGEFYTNIDTWGRNLETEFLDGRWSRDLTPQSCKLDAQEGKIDKANLLRFAVSSEYNLLSSENKIIVNKYILEYSDFKDKDHYNFDPLSIENKNYLMNNELEKNPFNNLFIDYLIELSNKFGNDQMVIQDKESSNLFLNFLIESYEELSTQNTSNENMDNYIDESYITNICYSNITYLENASHIFFSNINPNGSYPISFLDNLFRKYGIDFFSLRNYKPGNSFNLNDIKSSDLQKDEYCQKESNLAENYAGRELIQENSSKIVKYIVLETNKLEKDRLDGTWLLGDTYSEYSGVSTGTNGRSSYSDGTYELGVQLTNELKKFLITPFVVFVHEKDKKNGSINCYAQFSGFSKTSEVKNILSKRDASFADGFKLSYWGIPLQFYSPRDKDGAFFIGTGNTLEVSKFYSSFDNKFDFDSFMDKYNENSYKDINLVPLKVGVGVNREKSSLINSTECSNALKSAREVTASYLR
ncbi:hypothetical protein N9E53_08780 [Amylibacter sp.]|nr:hypothetical protein [Amylibacter sp.]